MSQDATNTPQPNFPSTPQGNLNQAYYDHWNWQRSWSANPYTYPATGYSQYHQYPYMQQPIAGPSQQSYAQFAQPYATTSQNFVANSATPVKSRSPSPIQLSEEFHHWDEALRAFLVEANLTQTLRGFEADMLIMNPRWEAKIIPAAIKSLMECLSKLGESKGEPETSGEELLEERKLKYAHFSDEQNAQTPTSTNRSISAFLAANRERNDASNRAEFVDSLRRQRMQVEGDEDEDEDMEPTSCARLDAKHVDRDLQMKYDIARNEDGPLRRTVKTASNEEQLPSRQESKTRPDGQTGSMTETDTADGRPGLDGRLKNVEQHFAIRYVPSPPRTLLARLKLLEDHIIKLEKEYPPWAALHFNQPNRGWPPPPRSTPIIVPPHLRQTETSSSKPHDIPPSGIIKPEVTTSNGSKIRNTASSLHRAVLERLEVQQAMSDLARK